MCSRPGDDPALMDVAAMTRGDQLAMAISIAASNVRSPLSGLVRKEHALCTGTGIKVALCVVLLKVSHTIH